MKKLNFTLLLALLTITSYAQNVLIDFNFQTSPYPSGITHNGVENLTKADDGVCTKGMVQINLGQFLQVAVSSCTEFRFNAKLTSSSARTVTIKYKKQTDATYTTAATTLSILAQQHLISRLYSLPLSVSNLPNGVYAVVFESSNGRSVAKFIKQ